MTFRPFIPRKYGTVIGCVSDVVRSHGGPEPVSVMLACSVPSVYGYTSETNGADISFAKMVALTDAAHPLAAQFMAAKAGGHFQPATTTESLSPMVALGDAIRETGEASAAALDALADGKVTTEEAPTVLKEIDEAVAALLAVRGVIVRAAGG